MDESDELEIIPYVTTYPAAADHCETVTQVFNCIKTTSGLSNIFKNKKNIKAKKQPRNLKKILTSSNFEESRERTVSKCQNSRCMLCDNILVGSELTFSNNKKFYVKENMNCNTLYCIYGIKYKNGPKAYIGETTNLRLRYNLHKQHVRERKKFTITNHINECSNGEFVIMPIYKMKTENEPDRKRKESYFIKQYNPELNVKI